MRWLMPMALMLVLALPLFAQPDPKQGMVQGVVAFEDGTPYAHTGVTVACAGEEFYADTDEKGIFTAQVPEGEATIRVRDQEQKVQVRGGDTVQVAVKLKLTGILLSLVTAQGDPMGSHVEEVVGGFRSGEDGDNRTYGEFIGNGRYWFPEVPDTATTFAAIARVGMGGAQAFRQRWTLDKAAVGVRRVQLTVAPPVNAKLRITDGAGAPLRERELRGYVRYDAPVANDSALWGEGPLATTPSMIRLSDISTDAQGDLTQEGIAPGVYQFWLLVGDKAGKVTKVKVPDDGRATPTAYAVTIGMHDVTQTVFGADDRPAAGATVHAVYAWKGKAVVLTQKADAAGKVTWKGLPPMRTIVWGDGVPAGVIPPDADTVVTPLPAPKREDEGISVSFTLANPDPMIKQLAWVSRGVEIYGGEEGMGDDMVRPMGAVDVAAPPPGADDMGGDVPPPPQPLTLNGNGQPGTSFSALIWTKTPVPLVATFVNAYVPYNDTGDGAEFALEFKAGARLRGTFAAKDGAAVPGVSELDIVPIAVGALQPLLDDPAVTRGGLLLPVEAADGSFTVSLPVPGTYRLLVDMYDRASDMPGLQFTVAGGNVDKRFALPEPLAVVPVGTEINWVTWNAPADTRTLVAAALGPQMPIFGPRADILAAWYRPSPDKLVVLTPSDAAQPTRTLSLRTVYLSSKPNDDGNAWILNPLMPTAMAPMFNGGGPERSYRQDGTQDYRGASQRHARAESLSTLLRDGGVTRANLWPGKYLLSGGMYESSPAGVVTVPADGAREIEVTANPNQGAARAMRSIQLAFPKADYAKLREHAFEYMALYADGVRMPNAMGTWGVEGGDDTYAEVPVGTKVISVQWLGVGVIRDVPVPAAKPDDNTRMALPAWQPGLPISGTLTNADGTPLAKTSLRIGTSLSDDSNTAPVTTDGEGRFKLAGGMPGVLFAMVQDENGEGGDYGAWTINVTAAGALNQTLAARPDRPRISLNTNDGNWESTCIWWMPTVGTPVRLPWRWNEIVTNSMSSGPGVLWILDGSSGRGQCVTIADQPQHMEIQSGSPSGHTLGIIFPFDMAAGNLGRITLTGQGARAGLSVTLTNPSWQYNPQLGLTLGQVCAVPAGTYTVTVDTGRGPVTGTVTVTEQGGSLKLGYPKAAL